jgi:hypothetical protein
MNLHDYINKYISLVQIHQSVDFSSKKSVKQGNKAMDQMIDIAKVLNNIEGGLNEFLKILDMDKLELKYYASFHIVEHMNPNESIKERCLILIRSKAEKEDILGYKYWLKSWDK